MELWEHELYTNKNVLFGFNKEIIEYDMESAGFSLIQEFKLLPDEVIVELKKLGKKSRVVAIGKLEREDTNLVKALKEGFKEARRQFFIMNDIDTHNLIAIKKDAIFTTSECHHQKFGDFINFRPKNRYTSFLILSASRKSMLELYYNPEKIDVKGIGDEKLKYHEGYMLDFFKTWFRKMETCTVQEVTEYTKRFIDKYKRGELNVGYYRRFHPNSDYIVKGGSDIKYMEYWDDRKDELDITYNYYHILMKMIKIPL